MRVAIISPFPLNPQIICGGIESVTYNQLMCLKNKDIDIDVISFNRGINKEKIHIFSERIHIHYMPLNNFPEIILWMLINKKRVIRKIRMLKADIVINQGYGVTSYCIGRHFKNILFMHGIVSQEPYIEKNIFISFFKKHVKVPLSIKSLNECNAIVTNTKYARKFISGYTNKQIYSINNPTQKVFFNVVNKGENNKILLFIGSISPRKSVHHLILSLPEVIKRHPQIKLNILGSIRVQSYQKYLLTIVKEYNLENYINFVGSVTEEEKIEHYKNSTIMILPSLEETAPVSISEAMAVGIPVIGSNQAGIPYMISDNETGLLFDYGNSKMLSDKICYLLDDIDLIKRMGLKSKEIAMKRWHPNVIGNELIDLYNNINNIRNNYEV